MTQRALDGPYIYFVTTNVKSRRRFFVSADRATRLAKIIVTACQMKHFWLLGYCILPNHFHLLVYNQNLGVRALERARHGEEDVKTQPQSTDSYPWRGLSSPRTFTLGDLMQSIKGNFSWQFSTGQFWQTRFIFKIVNDKRYLENVIDYARFNYRKMNLPESFGQAPFVSIDQQAIDHIFNP